MKHSFGIKTIYTFFIFCSLFFIYPLEHTHAQMALGPSKDDISAEITPEFPGPNQTVSVVLDSYAIDLNTNDITWTIDGKKVLSGKGQKRISFKTGTLGTQTTVKITIGGLIEKTLIIAPTTVDLIWEANTYTPPFFKGRPIFTAEANVTIVAIPHILRGNTEVSPANLVYKWSNNGDVLGDYNGYGKNTLTIYGSIIPRPMDITVEVTDPGSSAVAFGETLVVNQKPLLLFYKNDPLYGIQYEKAITDTYDMTTNEIKVTAVPYYFNTKIKDNSTFTYTWQINGVPIDDGLNSATKVFRRIGDAVGMSNISLSVTKNDTIFQTAKNNFMINFKK